MSAFFTENVDATGGAVVTGAQMDGNLVLLKAGAIGYITGSGPAPSGANNDFTDWQPIAGSDVGNDTPGFRGPDAPGSDVSVCQGHNAPRALTGRRLRRGPR